MRQPHQVGVVARRIDHDEVVGVLGLVDCRREAAEFRRLVLVDANAFRPCDAEMVRP